MSIVCPVHTSHATRKDGTCKRPWCHARDEIPIHGKMGNIPCLLEAKMFNTFVQNSPYAQNGREVSQVKEETTEKETTIPETTTAEETTKTAKREKKKEEKKERKKSPDTDTFYKALVEAVELNKGEAVTSGGIAKITKTTRGPVRAAMKKLTKEGKVESIACESGKAKFLYKPA